MLGNEFCVSEYAVSVVICFGVILTTCPSLVVSNGEIVFKEHTEISKEDTCHTHSGEIGKCVNINNCSSRLAIIKDRQSICGWENAIVPKVCCIDTSKSDEGKNCTTTDNSPGYCFRFTQCELILSMLLKTPFDPETIRYVKNNRCGIKKFDVCCDAANEKRPIDYSDYSEVEEEPIDEVSAENGQCRLSSTPPDISSGCCGQGEMAYRNIPGEIAAIDQYPWTAILEYENKNSSSLNCGGVLISGQYVLTAAHCVTGDTGKPKNVLLGDYNIEISGPDCVEIPGGGLDCSSGVLSIAIKKIFPHPDFNTLSSAKANDIAVVRMVEIAPYTDFIRPICLPTADITKAHLKDKKAIQLDVTGWGLVGDAPPHSEVKRFVTLPFVNSKDCFRFYYSNNVYLGDEHICAGGKEKDSCKGIAFYLNLNGHLTTMKAGDSGGALMLDKKLHTEVVGLASFGFHPCGKKARPAVYTNVYHYLPWIRKIIY